MAILTNPIFRAIDRIHITVNNLFKNRFPLFSLYFFIKPREWVFWRTQPVHQIINGKFNSKSVHPSILFFTVHKSASMFSSQVIKAVAVVAKLVHIDLEGYYATKSSLVTEKSYEDIFLNNVFCQQGYFYGPLRLFRAINKLDAYKVILLLRDPRDVLTSHYFSVRNSHLLVSRKYIKRRKIALKKTIDQHVIDHIPRFLNAYETYCDNLVGKPYVLLIRYEDWVLNFKNEVDKIVAFCDFKFSDEQKKELYSLGDFEVKKEDVNQHRRKVTPGDYKEKLQPETILILNDAFRDILIRLNYPMNQ